uniref:Secreted protein n=1 Tax=Heterorhabditis bacteriophora TaxID=37862 RepID=A0A1I7XLY7_HETBA
MPLFQFVFVLLGCISFSTAVPSINTCHRLKEIYEEVPAVIDFSTRDICRSELELLQCDLMSKLVLENSRSKITELRVKVHKARLREDTKLIEGDRKRKDIHNANSFRNTLRLWIFAFNNCYENEGLLEPAPLEDRCSLIEELPSKSVNRYFLGQHRKNWQRSSALRSRIL